MFFEKLDTVEHFFSIGTLWKSLRLFASKKDAFKLEMDIFLNKANFWREKTIL